MKIDFIGTGVITEAIVKGLCATKSPLEEVLLSERGSTFSSRLMEMYDVVLAIRPDVAESVIWPLKFSACTQVISLIATVPEADLTEWIGDTLPLCRAIPLPFVAEGIGVTAIYPSLSIAEDLFSPIG